jgi:hypothetical protein
MNSYEIVAFYATDNRSVCDEFSEGHIKVLGDFGITNVTSNSYYWKDDPKMIVITCREKDTGIMVGGVRIELKYDGIELPLEKGVGYMDERVYDEISNSFKEGTCEICGLWTSRRAFGKGIAMLVSRVAVGLVPVLPVNSVYCLVAQFTRDMVKSLGFRELMNVGNDGEFPYPNDRFQAYVLSITDIHGLPNATDENRDFMHMMRENEVFVGSHTSPRGELEIHYNLRLNQFVEVDQ